MATSIQKAVMEQKAAAAPTDGQAKQSISVMVNSLLDTEGYRKRFNELLGARAPQFVSSIVSMVNADKNLQQAFLDSPMTVIQSALKAATFDLPIDPALGYAYIVPFSNSKRNADGSFTKKMEAVFILGYKGMNQLALRTGVYKTINVIDVREGELKKYDRLTEEIELEFIEDEEEREKREIVGWCGYFKLINGTEKKIYMTVKQIMAHEQKFRKGQVMGKGWRENFDAMCQKTVFRRLIGKWGLMSIDYQKASPSLLAAADAIATGKFDDEEKLENVIDLEPDEMVDAQTGELINRETGEVTGG